jgi:manganese/iron transport system ATP-binding protein
MILKKPSPHVDTAPIVAVDNISVQYNGHFALEDISFELKVGERIAVVGPNGAGKSTLFKVLAGLLRPSQGSVSIKGHEPGGHVCIAYIPQRSQVDWSFPVNVTDVVMMGRIRRIGFLHWPSSVDRQSVRESLEQVGMADLSVRQIGELSGGQQQRVFIARALAQEAELMLLDEPFTGLDVKSQQDIVDILDMLRRRGVTVVVATHDLSLAADAFDRTMLLNHKLIGFGTAQDTILPDLLADAYGGKLQVVPTSDGIFAFDDACCGEGVDHHD